MSNGEKTYEAMELRIKQAIIKDFMEDFIKDLTFDWEELCGDAYKGFVLDLEDDLTAEMTVGWFDGDDEIPEDERELEVHYVIDDNAVEILSKSNSLSDMLIESYKRHDKEMLPCLERSLKRFYAHIGKEG